MSKNHTRSYKHVNHNAINMHERDIDIYIYILLYKYIRSIILFSVWGHASARERERERERE